MLRQACNVHAVNDYPAAIYGIYACDHIKHRGFARAVTADDSNEITVVKVEIDAVECLLFIDCSGVEGLFYCNNIKHLPYLPSAFSRVRALMRTASSNTG